MIKFGHDHTSQQNYAYQLLNYHEVNNPKTMADIFWAAITSDKHSTIGSN